MSRNVIAGIIAAVVVLVGVLVGVRMMNQDDATQMKGADEVTALLDGIPQNGNVLGRPNAPVTVTEFIDFKCPVCAAASQGVVPTVIERYVRAGKVKIELKPIAFIGPDSEIGAVGSFAAARQDKMWQYTEVLLRNQGEEHQQWITDDVVKAAAKAAGADDAAFTTAYADTEALAKDLTDNSAAFQKASVMDDQPGTPFWVVAGPSGKLKAFSGAAPEPLISAIDEALGSN